MISSFQPIAQGTAQSPAHPIAPRAKTQTNPGTTTGETQSTTVPSTQPAQTASTQAVSPENTLTAILLPIADADQAAAATHHAGRLMQAQPGAAMIAQANSHSQSVQRLLQ